MAHFFSIAPDGIVRAHNEEKVALRKIRRGGRLQVGGLPRWYTFAEFEPIVRKHEEERAARRAAFEAHHRKLHAEWAAAGKPWTGYILRANANCAECAAEFPDRKAGCPALESSADHGSAS